MAAKIFRINYKSDFILTLNSDAGWMTPFCIKFWTGAPSQAFFAQWDGETYTHCSYDPSEPTKLVVQFDDHHLPIGDLKFQIAYHFTVADFPNDTEDEVINPANITTEIDGQEYQVMLDFTGETAPEIEFSLPAYANEQQRIANEQEREQKFAQMETDFESMQHENEQAVQGAENVNAQLNGTILTVTDRTGHQTSSNVQGPPGPPGSGVQADWNETDPAAADYIKNKPIVYTQQQVDQKLAEKQNVITDLQTIRSGAQAGSTAYQKPQAGIPKTDLAQGVKDSLDLADTALQEDTLYEKVNNNGYEYVDLGLPSGTLWAKCNIGAVSELGFGNSYMYGKGARQYNREDAIYEGTENPLDLSVDTARQVLGGSWRMPTQAQMEELVNNTTYEWVTINGINGGKFTATNGNYVFFPAAGIWDTDNHNGVGIYGFYLGSSLDGSDDPYCLFFDDVTKGVGSTLREYGLSVRGIILPEKTQLKKDLDKKADKVPNATNGNFAGLDANGNLTDSGSKASDFATTQQLPTTMGASGSGHKGGLVPDTPAVAGTTKFLCEDGTWKVVDMSGKEDVTAIEAPVNTTDATLPITSLNCEIGKYNRIDVAVDTLAVTLPAMAAGVTSVKTVVLYLTGGTTPAVTISSTAPSGGTAPAVHFSDGFAIESGKTYEVNCLWNGAAWIVGSLEINTSNS